VNSSIKVSVRKLRPSRFERTQNPTNWQAFIQLNKEIQSLSDVLLSEQQIGQTISLADPQLLRNTTRLHNGYAYVIACNIDAKPMNRVNFILPTGWTYASEAQVLFEDRAVEVTAGQFIDKFSSHSRHVYKIKVKEDAVQ
tara:strand:+ start:580 stop:999 length:420 start_codon:yes stop_codon:yes gene_type:complete